MRDAHGRSPPDTVWGAGHGGTGRGIVAGQTSAGIIRTASEIPLAAVELP